MKKQHLTFSSLSLFLIATILIFNSCRKNRQVYDPIVQGEQFDNSQMTNATFLGQIIKEDGTPLDAAMVSMGTHQSTTDADGFFFFTKISVPQNAALVKVEKAGYYNGYRTIHVIENQDNQVKIMMMELPVAETFQASTGGAITIAAGGTIEFPANAIVDATTNQIYNGAVSVFAKRIDPSNSDLRDLIPGAARGINAQGSERGLHTFGIEAVELFGAAGQKLQLGNGQQASLKLPISSMQAAAPNSIPLWHFDEARSMWVEEGVAEKIGNEYLAKVSHFSFWFWGTPFNTVSFQCQLVDGSSNPIANAFIRMTSSVTLGFQNVGYGYSNSNGIISGLIPQNATFDLEFNPAGCGGFSAPIYIQSFSSATSNINLGAITSIPNSTPATITGVVHDCSNNILANAPVVLRYNALNVYTVVTNAAGAFSMNVSCVGSTTSATIRGYDAGNSVYGTNNITIAPGTATNAGIISACATQYDFITWSVTNPPATTPTTYTLTDPTTLFGQALFGANTYINAYGGANQSVQFMFDGPQTVAGVHNLISFGDNIDSTAFATFSPSLVNLTNYQAVGGQIEGSFSTTFNGGTVYNNALINCSFRVTRMQ